MTKTISKTAAMDRTVSEGKRRTKASITAKTIVKRELRLDISVAPTARNILECADLSALLVGCDLSQSGIAALIYESGVKPPRTKALTGQRTPKN